MSRLEKAFPLIVLLALCAGCAKVVAYRPAPIAPAATAHQLEARRLSDLGLEHFIAQNLGHPVSPWPTREWDLQTLTLAALYFSPQMDIARDQLAASEAAVVTAGEHPNPTLSLTPGIPSPWLFDMPFVWPIETHGKRALRIEEARHLSSAAKISLAQTAWNVTSGVRKALLAYEMAEANLAVARSTQQLETRQVSLLGRRLASGEGARPALQTARIALSNARFATSEVEGQVTTARSVLAAAIGVPVSALDGLEITWPDIQQLPAPASLSPQRIQRDAVLNRLDVRRALDQYAAADAALRLQIANQYPNYNIGPGYAFEEGNNYFTVPLSLVLPIRNRNQGPIAQAEALRKEAAANFLAVQASAIAQSEQALAAYRSALAALKQADRPVTGQHVRIETTEHSVAAGESDHLQLNSLLLEGTLYARQHLQALAQAQAALGALEDAVERPLGQDASNFPAHASAIAARSPKESEQ
jgi:cobalt-zinc-cadmium efflux system outer membrane protein